MTEDKITQVLSTLQDKLPQDELIYLKLKSRLAKADDKKVDSLLFSQLHNPTHVLLYSLFFGALGVDRFMIGDTGLGVAKLLFGWVTCGLWSIIDIFICHKKAKEKNLKKLLQLLS